MMAVPGLLDLGDPAALALLRRLDLYWGGMDAPTQAATLAALEVTVPPPAMPALDGSEDETTGPPLRQYLLPGGSLALGDPRGGFMVCDPADALAFDGATARRLHIMLSRRHAGITVLHGSTGAESRPGPPPVSGASSPYPQAVTVLPAKLLQRRTGWTGPSAIQWHVGGAVAWPFAPAPALLALATVLTGVRLVPDASAIFPERWGAGGADEAFALVSPALAAHLDDLLTLDVSDALRWALIRTCTDGPASLASRMAEALFAVPSFLLPDPALLPGAPDGAWEETLAVLQHPHHPQVLLGLTQPHRAVSGLRAALKDQQAHILVAGTRVAVETDAALFALRQAQVNGRLAILLCPPADGPVALYGMARDVALRTGGTVLAAAPCWGFRHRIEPDGREAGNAAWFGMGAALDEIDLLCADAF
ncbi:hypothetical protein [Rhodovastum atsumiense]|uniref:hypothetical protein n=1 Tax=Rhodovastum atsumiense TaxID=504468 RepID=UPI0020246E6C|nr:hypothetical protein [Rhodovastum atsumiense]